jgi:ATP-dependent DNA ligase
LDGEMVAYAPEFKGFLPFGTLKSTSVDGEEVWNSNVDINDPTKPHPFFNFFFFFFFFCII